MAEREEIKTDNKKLASRVFAHGGAQMVVEAMKEAPMKDRLPGFAYALAIAEAEAAKLTAEMHIEVLREAARKGVDVGASREVAVRSLSDHSVVLSAAPADLVDLAESSDG